MLSLTLDAPNVSFVQLYYCFHIIGLLHGEFNCFIDYSRGSELTDSVIRGTCIDIEADDKMEEPREMGSRKGKS